MNSNHPAPTMIEIDVKAVPVPESDNHFQALTIVFMPIIYHTKNYSRSAEWLLLLRKPMHNPEILHYVQNDKKRRVVILEEPPATKDLAFFECTFREPSSSYSDPDKIP